MTLPKLFEKRSPLALLQTGLLLCPIIYLASEKIAIYASIILFVSAGIYDFRSKWKEDNKVPNLYLRVPMLSLLGIGIIGTLLKLMHFEQIFEIIFDLLLFLMFSSTVIEKEQTTEGSYKNSSSDLLSKFRSTGMIISLIALVDHLTK